MTDREKQQLVSEVNILRELRHPNIVRYYERSVDREKSRLFLVMEYCSGGDLAQLIKKCQQQQ
jgi:NIMA (never in mitosis gene a)-related kinase